jgi:hypothetical protein
MGDELWVMSYDLWVMISVMISELSAALHSRLPFNFFNFYPASMGGRGHSRQVQESIPFLSFRTKRWCMFNFFYGGSEDEKSLRVDVRSKRELLPWWILRDFSSPLPASTYSCCLSATLPMTSCMRRTNGNERLPSSDEEGTGFFPVYWRKKTRGGGNLALPVKP